MSFFLLHLRGMPIEEQLKLEEFLLTHDHRNICLINEGSSPAIVVGISGKPEELIDLPKAQQAGIPILRRCSGGGTVVVDEETVFVSFICQAATHPFPVYPEPITRWVASLYTASYERISLRDNDFVIGEKKCGGNAQYLKRDRWLHHTSFLWNFSPHHMELLHPPKRQPAYRDGRSHLEFLTPLAHHLPNKGEWIERLTQEIGRLYKLEPLTLGGLGNGWRRHPSRVECLG